jgi:hypothetical protein
MPINLDAPTPSAIPRLGGSNPLQARLIWRLPLPNPIGGSHPSAPQIWKLVPSATQVCHHVIPARFEAGFAGPSPGAPGKPPRPSVGFPETGGPAQIQTSLFCWAHFCGRGTRCTRSEQSPKAHEGSRCGFPAERSSASKQGFHAVGPPYQDSHTTYAYCNWLGGWGTIRRRQDRRSHTASDAIADPV